MTRVTYWLQDEQLEVLSSSSSQSAVAQVKGSSSQAEKVDECDKRPCPLMLLLVRRAGSVMAERAKGI